MSSTDDTKRASLKRKLEDAEVDLPNSKRQKLHNDNIEETKLLESSSSTISIKGLTLDPLSEHHALILHESLDKLRMNLKEQHDIQHLHEVFTDDIMTQLSRFAPISMDNLSHFEGNVTKYGEQIISVISDYIHSNALQSPFQSISPSTSTSTSNTHNGINGLHQEQKEEETLDNTNDIHENIEESENDKISCTNNKKRKRFIDSESDDDDDDDVNDIQHSSNSKPKFVYGDHIETVGYKIPDIMDENEEEHSEDQDEDLEGFVVDDDDVEDEDDHTLHRRILRINTDEDDLYGDNEFEPDFEQRLETQETLETYEDSDDSVEIMGRRSTRNRRNHNNPRTPIIDDHADDEDDDDDDDDDDTTHRILQRLETTESVQPQLLRFFTNQTIGNVEASEVNGLDDIESDDDEEAHEESDGESLNSIDDEIDREIFGIDDVRLSELSFENAVKRKSLVDMIKIFENGFNIKEECSFWMDYDRFMKIFNDKTTKALRLISVLLPLGFGDGMECNTDDIGIYDPTLFTMMKRKDMDDIPIDEHQHPQEHAFLTCIKSEVYYRIPSILEHGISPNIIPKFFVLMDEFRTNIIRKWFDAITFQNIKFIKQQHMVFGIPIDIKIPRKIIRHVLETDFEHLQGATGLIIASLVGALEIVKYFVQNGADIEYKTCFGNDTALMFAAKRGNVSVVEYLCTNGADINATTTQSEAYADTPSPVAFEALVHSKKEVLEYLAYYGADLYLIGPSNSCGENVNVMRLCLMEEKYGLNEIRNGLKKRFDFIKQCLSKQFSKDIDIMNNIGFVICDEFLNPANEEYLDELKVEYAIDCDDD